MIKYFCLNWDCPRQGPITSRTFCPKVGWLFYPSVLVCQWRDKPITFFVHQRSSQGPQVPPIYLTRPWFARWHYYSQYLYVGINKNGVSVVQCPLARFKFELQMTDRLKKVAYYHSPLRNIARHWTEMKLRTLRIALVYSHFIYNKLYIPFCVTIPYNCHIEALTWL